MAEERDLSSGDGDDQESSPGQAAAVAADARPTGPGAQGWRAQKKERTRRVLVDVALDLFERRGYDATSVEEVAAAGGVSPRTVFRYFPAKHDLLFDDLQVAIDFLRRAVADRPASESTFEVLRDMAVTHAEAMSDPVMLRRVSLIMANPSLRAHALEVRERIGLEIGDALGERDGTLDPAVALLYGQVAALALSRAIVLWIEGGANDELGELTEAVFDALRGLLG